MKKIIFTMILSLWLPIFCFSKEYPHCKHPQVLKTVFATFKDLLEVEYYNYCTSLYNLPEIEIKFSNQLDAIKNGNFSKAFPNIDSKLYKYVKTCYKISEEMFTEDHFRKKRVDYISSDTDCKITYVNKRKSYECYMRYQVKTTDQYKDGDYTVINYKVKGWRIHCKELK